jgi:hypothetical protein
MSELKIRARNFPMWLLKPLFKVASFGEKKHGSLSFLTAPITVNDHLDALKRHLIALEDPSVPDLDDESKELHSAHIAWRALAITHLLTNKKELDDRYKGEVKQEYTPSPRWSVNSDGTVSVIEPDKTPDNFLTIPTEYTEYDKDGNPSMYEYLNKLAKEDEQLNERFQKLGTTYIPPNISADSVSAGDTDPRAFTLEENVTVIVNSNGTTLVNDIDPRHFDSTYVKYPPMDLTKVQDGYIQEDEKVNLTLCKCGKNVKKD